MPITPSRPALTSKVIRLVLPATLWILTACSDPALTEREKRVFASLSLTQLKEPQQPSNRYLHNTAAQHLGNQLFHDKRLSKNQKISCVTCHKPELAYTDNLKTPVDNGLGHGSIKRNTPALIGSAWNTWQYWDGRRDSLWSQALTPLEAPAEMASNRVALSRLILSDNSYKAQYEEIFGTLPLTAQDLTIEATPMGTQAQKRAWYTLNKPLQHKINTVFANIGKAIAAYESTLRPQATRFDQFVEKLINSEPWSDTLSKKEVRGARLFIDDNKTQCLECHNGPLLSNGNFHSIGSGTFTGDSLDYGRTFGVQAAMLDEFNCLGRYSDASKDQCKHLQFMNRTEIAHNQGAFKTPSLRNVVNTAPYFHDGRFATLREVMLHYNNPPQPLPNPQHDLRDFKLSDKEIDQLLAFLETLNATQ